MKRIALSLVDGSGLVAEHAVGDTSGMTFSAGLSGGYDFLWGDLRCHLRWVCSTSMQQRLQSFEFISFQDLRFGIRAQKSF
jgi:hypothetical protein